MYILHAVCSALCMLITVFVRFTFSYHFFLRSIDDVLFVILCDV